MVRRVSKWALGSAVVVIAAVLPLGNVAPSSAAIAPLTRAFIDAEPGSYLVPDGPMTFTDVAFDPADPGQVRLTMRGGSSWYELQISPPVGEDALHVGVYENASTIPWYDRPELEFAGTGRSCGAALGSRFIIDDIAADAAGVVQSLSLRFEYVCTDSTRVFGAVSINSTADFRGRTLSHEQLDFGDLLVGDSVTRELVIHNLGPSSLTVLRATIEGDGVANFSVTGNSCVNVPADAKCAIEVTYSATENAPPANAQLIWYDELAPAGGNGRRVSLTASSFSARGEFTALTPARILDTRGGVGEHLGPLGPAESIDVQINGVGGVPESGVSAVVLNATAVDPTSATYLTIWPAGAARPDISNVNAAAGQVRPNLVTVAVGDGGRLSLFNESGRTHVLFDVVGYYSTADGQSGARFHAFGPARALDTRGVDGRPVPLGPGEVRPLTVVSTLDLSPPSLRAVVLNVTVTDPSADGYLTVYPADVQTPTASSLNFVARQTVPNLVVVRVPDSGTINLFNFAGEAHVIVDVVGYFDLARVGDAGRFIGLPPTRLVDTRLIDSPLDPNSYGVLTVAGYADVPSNASAAVLNVTVADPTATGYLSVFPDDACRLPATSNLNFVPGEAAPNLVMARLSIAGGCAEGPGLLDIYNSAGTTQVIVDLFGYFM